ncbi:MAG: carbonic anhydrase family protein, partial [Gammaproteobacteria bacterium]|nr:carbonic anhydrase family protein [Gammaproteobacteria bacterium]
NTLGEVAIVAVFLQGNTSQNGFVDQALANAPQVVSTNQTAVTVNALDLIPTNTAAFFASSADTPIEYTPVAYSPIADTAMAYTPVHWGDKEKWKATWKEWKQALRDLFDRNRAQEREREKRRAMVKARKAAKAALKAAAKAERKAAKAERKAARKAAKAERKAARKDDDGTSGDTGTPPGDTGTPPGDTGTPPGDTGTPPVATALQVDTYFEYMGSLTMPMCPNNTRWFVLPAVVNVSSNSVATMQQLVAAFPNYDGYPYNYRPTQPLFGRTIKQIQP